jgi:potassium-dependent mechanosensitive channel
VVLQNFGTDLLNFEIRAIVRDVNFGLNIRSEMNLEIAKRFFAEGIEFAGGARAHGSAGRHAKSAEPEPAAPTVVILRDEREVPPA